MSGPQGPRLGGKATHLEHFRNTPERVGLQRVTRGYLFASRADRHPRARWPGSPLVSVREQCPGRRPRHSREGASRTHRRRRSRSRTASRLRRPPPRGTGPAEVVRAERGLVIVAATVQHHRDRQGARTEPRARGQRDGPSGTPPATSLRGEAAAGPHARRDVRDHAIRTVQAQVPVDEGPGRAARLRSRRTPPRPRQPRRQPSGTRAGKVEGGSRARPSQRQCP